MNTALLRSLGASVLAAGLLLVTTATAWADPPARVARLSYLAGEVSFAPAGEDAWHAAQLNRPVVVGDRLWADRGARLELEMGTAVLRLDQGSAIEFLNLNDALAQVQITQGVLNLRVDRIHEGQVYEIDTPTLAMVVSEPGEFRIDIAPTGDSTQVTVFSGRADIYGESGQLVRVASGNSIRFHDPSLANPRRMDIPPRDDFDNWAFARNDRYLNSPTRRYVSAEMIGYADLDAHGSWRPVAEYGHVWFPRHVSAGWAPYRDGRWSWIEPWGWTWVDDHPWGFAPSHYGRWVYVSSGWGWVPGPRHLRPVFAPALVAFVGGSGWRLTVSTGGPPIGWFPLGPHDIYMPWYRVSRSYFSRVNVHNTVVVNNIYVTNFYNDYYVQGRVPRRNYTFRNAANAVTVVPRDSFVGNRRAADTMAHLRPGALRQGELLTRAPATPVRASLAGTAASRTTVPESRQRSVVARHQPAPTIAGFDQRQAAIARNGGEPLASDQLQRLSADTPPRRERSVRVIEPGRQDGSRTSIAARPDRDTAVRGQLGEVGIQPTPVRVPDSHAGSPEATARSPVTAPASRPSRTAAEVGAPAREAGRAGSTQDSVSARQGIALPESTQRGRALPSSRYVPRDAGASRSTAPATSRQAPSQSRSIEPGVRSVVPQSAPTPAPAPRSTQPATRQPQPATSGSGSSTSIRLPATQPRAPATISAPARSTAPVTSGRPATQAPPPRQSSPALRSQPPPATRSAPPAGSRSSAPSRSIQQATPAAMPAPRNAAPAASAGRSSAPAARSAPAPVREPASSARSERSSSRSQERR